MVLTIVESSFWSPWRGKTARQCLFINAESLQYGLIGNKSVHCTSPITGVQGTPPFHEKSCKVRNASPEWDG